MITRRNALKTAALASMAYAATPWESLQAQAIDTNAAPVAPKGPFVLPPLPYAYDALTPFIDAQTMQLHHDKHHAAYVSNLNKAVADYPAVGAKPITELLKNLNDVPEKIRATVRNNGGGHYNHSLFWLMMKKGGGGLPGGDLGKRIDKTFGGFPAFKQQFSKAATSQFGSGWAWLVLDNGELKIASTPNQDSPISEGKKVLLGIDVWEHAYYLKYQNRRAEYISAWFNVVNWGQVTRNMA